VTKVFFTIVTIAIASGGAYVIGRTGWSFLAVLAASVGLIAAVVAVFMTVLILFTRWRSQHQGHITPA
jgi:membrane protein YdbS with pleckstrin-like domain